jgi:hypothetical protein
MKVLKIGGEEEKPLTGRKGYSGRIRGSRRMKRKVRIKEEEDEKEAVDLE